MIEKAADLLEQRAAHFIALLQREGGKTLDDALSEVREATDFCRYYAAEGAKLFGEGETMPGPTGESNVLEIHPRGVVLCLGPDEASARRQAELALAHGNGVIVHGSMEPVLSVLDVRGFDLRDLFLIGFNDNCGSIVVETESRARNIEDALEPAYA